MPEDDRDFFDAYTSFLGQGTSGEPVGTPDPVRPLPSHGAHPQPGQYVIDPDYMEVLGLEDPSELFRYFK